MRSSNLVPNSPRIVATIVAVWLAVGSVSAQSNVAGNWTLEVDSPQGPMKAGLVLTVDGDALKGSISSEMGTASFTGTSKDGAVKFTFDMTGPNGPMTITTSATVDGDAMKGEMDYGMGIAPFTGKRAEQ